MAHLVTDRDPRDKGIHMFVGCRTCASALARMLKWKLTKKIGYPRGFQMWFWRSSRIRRRNARADSNCPLFHKRGSPWNPLARSVSPSSGISETTFVYPLGFQIFTLSSIFTPVLARMQPPHPPNFATILHLLVSTLLSNVPLVAWEFSYGKTMAF